MTLESDRTTETISGFFMQDHREIDAILKSIRFDSSQEALPKFKEFDRRLERHINWEENILFPTVSRKAPQLEVGPIRVMKIEHQQIRENKAGALKALINEDVHRAKNYIEAMLNILSDHNAKEEKILYPTCDRLMTEETGEVLKKVRTT